MKYLFLHGLISFPSDWDPVIAELKATGDHRVEVPALQFLTREIVAPEDYADALAAELPDGYLDDDCIVAGHSIGCTVALCLLERVRHAFLIAPHTRFRTDALPLQEADMIAAAHELTYDPAKFPDEIFHSHIALWAGILKSTPARIRHLKQLKAALANFDHQAYYLRYADKITFVLGKQDPISRPEDFTELRARLPTTEFVEIDRCCHAIPLEQPAVVAGLLLGGRVPA